MELIRMLRTEKRLCMSLMRPAETWVHAQKPFNGRFVRVIGTGPGPIENFNKEHPSQAIGVNDRIVSVNGVRGSAARILSVLTHEEKLDIQFLRYGPYSLGL